MRLPSRVCTRWHGSGEVVGHTLRQMSSSDNKVRLSLHHDETNQTAHAAYWPHQSHTEQQLQQLVRKALQLADSEVRIIDEDGDDVLLMGAPAAAYSVQAVKQIRQAPAAAPAPVPAPAPAEFEAGTARVVLSYSHKNLEVLALVRAGLNAAGIATVDGTQVPTNTAETALSGHSTLPLDTHLTANGSSRVVCRGSSRVVCSGSSRVLSYPFAGTSWV